ncbi:MAG: 3-phosphoglycerate dehydrogenase [Flavobacteriia bacterium]|nr:3-phosphoglycerate dehydrogenase [Flavobacteriia bacterium]OIP45203.1 MAG: 3-phosphoglycerate dehydrogenase [Flavobacteriaceae bacterium CG2_30_31_66]PIV97547.1 MAG: 3-phosphoglycerate dehydrogenase [Flavobacteriaceae bacterium CG17_big_fil_post_rev_8_21_14_2_50_31_13]PIX11110.1 MAG: 3-phosphoglycerate dehydrogenase [Flavobacteriaceae bacterium CG_4_8_14_3_um_filter_31_8]PIY14665.1 MAG: 3-phosphoglycerate dehydrogenase [Flavobacteriaceae bacterium CG_4_10_14_3_um_filter_31_253]PIZ10103.1 MA
MKILANDGISKSGIAMLEKNGFSVIITKVAQNQLKKFINEEQIDVLLVRSTTQVSQELIEACPSLKLIGKGGIGMENIDVEFAIDHGLHVINTPDASSNAVAELVFAHLFGMARFLHASNREMPLEGDTHFNELKKAFSQGIELREKTLGIIGFGSIGQEVAKIAIGLGMNVIASDTEIKKATIELSFFNQEKMMFSIETQPLETLLTTADFISLHLPAREEYTLTAKEFAKMKNGVGIINTARGGVLNEVDLINAIESGKVQFAGLDVFESEPTPEIQILMNPEVSLSPHIGGETLEVQERIGIALATQIIDLFAN